MTYDPLHTVTQARAKESRSGDIINPPVTPQQQADDILPSAARTEPQNHNHKTGHFYEKLAQLFLMFKGYSLIARNYVTGRGTGAGEVDLIMKRGKTLIFVEVKKRPTLNDALHAITLNNQQRVITASAAFLAHHPQYSTYNIRYDAVLFAPKRFPKHLKEAWRVL